MPTSLPLLGEPPRERSDAARNREALLAAADELIGECGVEAVTMEAIAVRAGVGKGTVFRRFDSREGLMGALLNRSETAFQTAVISGPPPLGPGAEPMARLLAFGRARLELNLGHRALIEAAGRSGARSFAAVSFTSMHVRHLLSELGVHGDLVILATALIAPLEVPILVQQVELDGIPTERVLAGWSDLVRRVVADPDRPVSEAPRRP
jgi:AcrR family transcriptional regulator